MNEVAIPTGAVSEVKKMKRLLLAPICLAVLASHAHATLLVHYQLDGNLNEVPATGAQDSVLSARDSANAIVAPNAFAFVPGVPGLGGQALVLGSAVGSNVQWAGTPDASDPDLGGLPSATDWTVEMFFQPKTLPGDNAFARLALHWTGGPADAYHFAIRNVAGATGPRVDIFTNYSGSGTQSVNGTTDLAVDTWYHGAAVNSGGTVTLYLNGVPQGNYSVTGNLQNNDNLLFFGSSTGASPFAGYVDDIRVWNEAVSGAYLTGRAQQVPEPATIALAGLAAPALLLRRRPRA